MNEGLPELSFVDDERGATPVIGIVLVVAITVVLAAVIGQYVFGLDIVQGQEQAVGPQASFHTDYDGSASELTIEFQSGQKIEKSEITFINSDGGVIKDDEISWSDGSDDTWQSGESVTLSGIEKNDTVRIVWESSTTDDSTILLRWKGPNA